VDEPLSHVDAEGRARMVDVSGKEETVRTAVAGGRLRFSPGTRERVLAGDLPKGGVLEVARLAGVMAAKRTHELIPLCHPLRLTRVDLELGAAAEEDEIEILATVTARDRTGVEMEALTAVSVAALTVYDMVKAVDRGMQIGPIRLLRKTGGQSGDWIREGS
jgi:cyclic pyranopterin phosphate synthase